MALTLTSNTVYPAGFCANLNSDDVSGCEEVVAAPGAGLCIYLEQIIISAGAALTFTVGAGETAGAVTAVLLGPFYLAANTAQRVTFVRPLKMAANTALVVDSGAGNVTVIAEGYIAA